MAPTKPTRGERNNNPGNIDYRPTDKWQGLADPPRETDVAFPRFARFTDPKWGIRAIARLLITYADKYDITTIRGIVNRWAPPVENDTGAYVQSVAKQCGVDADEVINVHSYAIMSPLVNAIITHENGRCIYSQSVIDLGLRLAGVLPKAPVAAKKTMLSPEGVGTGTGSLGLAGMTITETAQQMQVATPEGSMILQIVFATMMMTGLGLTVYGLIRRTRGRSE